MANRGVSAGICAGMRCKNGERIRALLRVSNEEYEMRSMRSMLMRFESNWGSPVMATGGSHTGDGSPLEGFCCF